MLQELYTKSILLDMVASIYQETLQNSNVNVTLVNNRRRGKPKRNLKGAYLGVLASSYSVEACGMVWVDAVKTWQ